MPKTPPQPNSPTSTHLPPSLPNSPLAKRPKIMAATPKSPLPSSVPLPQTPTSTVETALRSGPNSASLSDPPLLVKKLSTDATTPTRGSAFAAGYDLYSARAAKIPAHGKGFAETDLAIAVPAGTYGRIAPRSGLASKNFIDTGAGVIDADYRGPVKVLLFNHSNVDFEVKQGDRIAQLVLEKICTSEVIVVEDLAETVRGAGGFGSTG